MSQANILTKILLSPSSKYYCCCSFFLSFFCYSPYNNNCCVCSLQLHCIKTMGKIRGTRLPGFCLNRIRPHARVRSPPMQQKAKHVDTTSATKIDQKTEEYSCSACEEKSDDGVVKPAGSVIGRKIMIVVDSSLEAKGAVQWALTHTVQNQDTIVLLHVMKPSKQGCETHHIPHCFVFCFLFFLTSTLTLFVCDSN